MKHHPLLHARGAIRSYIAVKDKNGQDVKRLKRIYKDLCVYIGMYVQDRAATHD